ncbi:MAG: type II secretion system F family protein [Chloroflexota bacterium]
MAALNGISSSVIFTASGVVGLCCVLAALALLRHLAHLEARLRVVEAKTSDRHRSSTWLAAVERVVFRVMPPAFRQTMQRRLDRSQLAGRLTPAQVLLLALAMALGGVALTTLVTTASIATALLPVYLVLAVLLSGFWFDRRATKRRQAVQNSLPATMDLLVLAMEAGLSLDAAIREVVAEWHSPASRELERVASLTQLGMTRGEALRDIAEMLDLETMRRLAGRVSAAERLGSSMVLILRGEAEEARRERRLLASKRIAQAPTKILLPTALLILPVTLIVLLGPALPQILSLAGG